MQERFKGKTEQYFFNTLAELARWIENTPATWRAKSSASANYGNSWDLGVGYGKAWTMARNGWNEGAQRAQAALKAFAPLTPSPDERTDFYGHRPHVARFCAGAPDSMIRHEPCADNGSGKVLTLVVNISVDCSQRAANVANYGLGIAQYVNQLESDGIQCEVIAACVQSISGKRVCFSWRVKGAEQPLDLANLSFAIGHPAMFRRICFALIERCKARECSVYGYPETVKASDVINAPIGTVALNGINDANTNAATPQAALDHIARHIETALEAMEYAQ